MSSREFLKTNYSVSRIGTVTIDGREFRFKSLTEFDRSTYDYTIYSDKSANDEKTAYLRARSRIIQHCLVDEKGRLEYDQSDEAMQEILALDCRITKQLADAISDHCGLNEDYEETKKNSKVTRDATLPTNSQKVSVA